jgi:predicted Zn finger-like uncharacterized protein
MIIQCEKCQTRFRLDDSKVTEKGVKVRCTKCKHVFKVSADGTVAESAQPAETPAAVAPSSSVANDTPPANQQFESDAAPPSPFDSDAFSGTSLGSAPAGFGSQEAPAFDESAFSFDSDAPQINTTETDYTTAVDPAAKGGEVDFSGFDFGDDDMETDSTPLSSSSFNNVSDAPTAHQATPPPKSAPQGLDFSDDDMFGAVVQAAAPETPDEAISFDFEGDSFAESMDMSGKDAAGNKGSLFSLESSGETPFNLGEIDFGDELTSVAVQQVNPDDLKPSQEILFAPLAEAQEKKTDNDLVQSFMSDDSNESQQEELPPLSITSRRKQSPIFGGLISVIAVLTIAVLGYFGYSTFLAPKEMAPQEAGKIGIRAVKATYIKHATAGELLVISGEAVNEYPEPRAALQVKATVFDASGQSVSTKSAYGGNPLTEKQLESLPLDKIESAMANQFGDSLANMEVAPGKAIPFVVVLANLPKNAKDFGVQSAGSTVATGKQQ